MLAKKSSEAKDPLSVDGLEEALRGKEKELGGIVPGSSLWEAFRRAPVYLKALDELTNRLGEAERRLDRESKHH